MGNNVGTVGVGPCLDPRCLLWVLSIDSAHRAIFRNRQAVSTIEMTSMTGRASTRAPLTPASKLPRPKPILTMRTTSGSMAPLPPNVLIGKMHIPREIFREDRVSHANMPRDTRGQPGLLQSIHDLCPIRQPADPCQRGCTGHPLPANRIEKVTTGSFHRAASLRGEYGEPNHRRKAYVHLQYGVAPTGYTSMAPQSPGMCPERHRHRGQT